MTIKNSLPCPFCNSTDNRGHKEFSTVYTSTPGFRIVCLECGAAGPVTPKQRDACAAWNDRLVYPKVEPPTLTDPQPTPVGGWEDFNRVMGYVGIDITDTTPGGNIDTETCIRSFYEALTILAAKVRNTHGR